MVPFVNVRGLAGTMSLIGALLILSGCSRGTGDGNRERPKEKAAQIASALSSGPNCAGAGDPTDGANTGFACTGALAAATFSHAICACGMINDRGSLTTDAFDSTQGGPNGGLGGDVAANGVIAWVTSSNIGGTVWTPSNLNSPGTSTIRGDLHLGGTLSGFH